MTMTDAKAMQVLEGFVLVAGENRPVGQWPGTQVIDAAKHAIAALSGRGEVVAVVSSYATVTVLDCSIPAGTKLYLHPAPAAMDGAAVLLDEYERQTKELPGQHEIPERGCSTYNWRMASIRDIRALAAMAKGA